VGGNLGLPLERESVSIKVFISVARPGWGGKRGGDLNRDLKLRLVPMSQGVGSETRAGGPMLAERIRAVQGGYRIMFTGHCAVLVGAISKGALLKNRGKRGSSVVGEARVRRAKLKASWEGGRVVF